MKILLALLLAPACGVLGRMGGSGRYPRWSRVVCIPLILTAEAFILGVHSWLLLLMLPLLIGAISTYYDVVPFNKGEDNFWMHGFFLGLACFPVSIATGHWWQLAVLCVVNAVWMGVWQNLVDWDVLEEFGRYFVLPLTLLLIL